MNTGRSWELRAETNDRRDACGGERTIVAFGDSIAFGWPLRYHDSYPAKLEGLLSERCSSPQWQVVNAGVPGNTVLLGAERYDRDVQAFWPSVVLIQFGLNDGALRRTRFDSQRERVWRAQRSRHARLWVTIDSFVRRQRTRLSGDARRVAHRPIPRVTDSVFADALADMIRRVRATGAVPWLVSLIPLHAEILSANQWSTYDRYDAIIRETASRSEAQLIDLRSADGPPFDAAAMLADDGIHLTECGHAWLAETLATRLIPEIAKEENESHQADSA